MRSDTFVSSLPIPDEAPIMMPFSYSLETLNLQHQLIVFDQAGPCHVKYSHGNSPLSGLLYSYYLNLSHFAFHTYRWRLDEQHSTSNNRFPRNTLK
jgi:hypothetical protein